MPVHRVRTPFLIAIGGLSGTGKSTLARALIGEFDDQARVLRSDVERKAMFGVSEVTPLGAAGYTAQATAAVYAHLTTQAKITLESGQSVLVDAVYARALERDAIQSVADMLRVPFAGFWLEAPLGVRVARIAGRRDDASEATATIAARQERYDLGDLRWHRIDAGQAPDVTLAQASAAGMTMFSA